MHMMLNSLEGGNAVQYQLLKILLPKFTRQKHTKCAGFWEAPCGSDSAFLGLFQATNEALLLWGLGRDTGKSPGPDQSSLPITGV